jgi:CHAD domain-containing protein
MTQSKTLAGADTTARLVEHTFAELHTTIIAQEPGVRQGDVEAIHDMRVATRRLRVALSNFGACWTKEQRRQIKLWTQSLADALGEVRDLDVLMESLKPQQARLAASERPFLANLIERLRKQRKRRFQTLLLFLDGALYRGFKNEFPKLLPPPIVAAATTQLKARQRYGQATQS